MQRARALLQAARACTPSPTDIICIMVIIIIVIHVMVIIIISSMVEFQFKAAASSQLLAIPEASAGWASVQ